MAAIRTSACAWPASLAPSASSDLDVSVVQPAAVRGGDAKQVQLATLRNIREAAIAGGLDDADEIDEIATELERYVGRPDTLVTTARIVQCWGLRPAG